MNNEPVAYIDPYDLERLPHYDCHIGSQQLKNGIPLYTHQYERPHNTVLVPCDKLAEMQAEIEALKADNEQMCKALFKATRAILRKAQEK